VRLYSDVARFLLVANFELLSAYTDFAESHLDDRQGYGKTALINTYVGRAGPLL
jgi:hypothetical protein